MLQMEIALCLVTAFVAYIYFTAPGPICWFPTARWSFTCFCAPDCWPPTGNSLKVIQMSRIKHPDTAFVIVSGYDDFFYCREALRLQITDYILKPVNYEEFGSCIDNLKIALFQRQASRQDGPREERTIHGITRFLQAHLAEELSLSVLAEEFHLDPQYISQLFKSEIGVGLLAYLTNIRMERAKKLLLTTALSIAEVSEQSGYGDYRWQRARSWPLRLC